LDDLHIKTFNLGAVDIVDLRTRRWGRREVEAWLSLALERETEGDCGPQSFDGP